MISQDWERAADKDEVFAVERRELIKQTYFSDGLKAAKITYKRDGNKRNANTLPKLNEESVQP